VLDVLVTEVLLNGSRVVTVVRQFVTRGVPEHMRMDWEIETRFLSSSSDHLSNR
jgi:hypothetical protein